MRLPVVTNPHMLPALQAPTTLAKLTGMHYMGVVMAKQGKATRFFVGVNPTVLHMLSGNCMASHLAGGNMLSLGNITGIVVPYHLSNFDVIVHTATHVIAYKVCPVYPGRLSVGTNWGTGGRYMAPTHPCNVFLPQ